MLRKLTGYLLLVFSCLAWLALPALAWLDLSVAETASVVAAMLLGAEVAFWLAVILLGRPVYERLKARLLRRGRPETTKSS